MSSDPCSTDTGKTSALCTRAAGFTLLEVLVALMIVAIALSALIKAGTENTANAAYLREKTFAHWVALNTITEMQVRSAWPAPGKVEGTAVMADREWDWTAAVETTVDTTVRRMTVEVRPKDGKGQPLVRLVSFLQQPIVPTATVNPNPNPNPNNNINPNTNPNPNPGTNPNTNTDISTGGTVNTGTEE